MEMLVTLLKDHAATVVIVLLALFYMNNQMASLRSDIGSDIAGLRSDIAGVRSDIAGLAERTARIEATVSGIDARLARVEGLVDSALVKPQ